MRKTHLITAAVVTITLVTPGVTVASTDPQALGEPVNPYGDWGEQKLDWRVCDWWEDLPDASKERYPRTYCADLTVPRDWQRLDPEQTLTVRVTKVPAADEAKRRGVLLHNPGGPGGDGSMLPTLVAAAEPGVHAVYDMIGFAPRGVDPSSTVYCVYDSDGPWEPGFDSRERTSANLDAMARVSANEAKACSSHDLSPQITTQQTVRDLDLLRAVLRESKISYLGYSYGTWLGAWYAATFKSRVDRFVLDSNMIWTSTFQRAVGLQSLGFERRFGQFKAWAARHHDTYGLGETPMKVNDAWEAVRAAMPLGFRDFLNSVTAQTMYADQVWPPFAQWLKSMQEGRSVSAASLIADGVPRALAVRLARLSEPSGDPIAVPGAFPAIACGDTPWTKDPTHWREAGAIGEKYPLIGYHQSVQPCGYYPFTDPNRPAINVNTVPRMLMVQNELDPATPVEGAVVPWRGTGQRLIGVLRGGNHGVYAADLNPCVERRVNGYLINGVMPSYDVFCEALPLPGDDAPPGSSTFAGKAVRKVEPAGQSPSLDSTAALAAQRVAEMIMEVNPPR